MREPDTDSLSKELDEAICHASDNAGVELLEARSFSAGRLACRLRRPPHEPPRAVRSAAPTAYAVPRGSRCLCPACTDDYRLVAALGSQRLP